MTIYVVTVEEGSSIALVKAFPERDKAEQFVKELKKEELESMAYYALGKVKEEDLDVTWENIRDYLGYPQYYQISSTELDNL